MATAAPTPARRFGRRWAIGLGAIAVLLLAGWWALSGGQLDRSGPIAPGPLPADMLSTRDARHGAPLPSGVTHATASRRILFGDLHVHTTFSTDAFMRSVPLVGGEGALPPSDACDFARYCSQLDFFALTDHAEALTPRHWRDTTDAIRACNAAAGDPAHPDLVAFAGWEWSHVGATPQTHWGHRCVILRDDDDAHLPARPVAADGLGSVARGAGVGTQLLQALAPILDFSNRHRYLDLLLYRREVGSVPTCPRGVDTRKLPADCREYAAHPGELYEKLGQWGFESLVIPHGTSWGFYTPPGYEKTKVLKADWRDPKREQLLEVFSGHGNSENWRDWRAVNGSGDTATCPEPTPGYEPCCWRAGEIIRSRCGDAPAQECERRVQKARLDHARAGVAGHRSVPGAEVADWGDCGQCRDCFTPAFNFRPGGSVQGQLARRAFVDGRPTPVQPRGLVGSSDNHTARPGTGYKEFARRQMADPTGPVKELWRDMFFPGVGEPTAESRTLDRQQVMELPPFEVVHLERQASFFMTGGLVAVHADNRSRTALWAAMKRREVYATSGERILLWFHKVHGERRWPMGAALPWSETPHFEVVAQGALEQQPGCPERIASGLGAEKLARLCLGECFHPGDKRRRISRVEVVRIRPQVRPDEPVGPLVVDPLLVLPCPATGPCRARFSDPEHATAGRDAFYYVRAIQEPTPAVNAGGVRCERDAAGNCLRAQPCYGDYRTPLDEDCLSPAEERAWSSPILLRHRAASGNEGA